jgi:hypothetical protein
MAQTRFSKVLTFQECSDLPKWSRLGIFSCHNCDKWRERLQLGTVSRASRCTLSERHYHCHRNKTGQRIAVGAFKTSTIKALNEVINEKNQGFFPSPSSVDRACAKLDDYAFNMIGYQRRDTIYGEVYFLNFEKALRFLLKACQLHKSGFSKSIFVHRWS